MTPSTRARTAATLGTSILVVLVFMRVGATAGVSSLRLPIATTKALGLVGVGLLYEVIGRRFRPVWWLWMIGGALNITAIAAGGWRMPASPDAIAKVRLPPSHPSYVDAEGWVQLLLGDSIPVTFAINTVISIGDIALLLGLTWMGVLLLRRAPETSRTAIGEGERRKPGSAGPGGAA